MTSHDGSQTTDKVNDDRTEQFEYPFATRSIRKDVRDGKNRERQRGIAQGAAPRGKARIYMSGGLIRVYPRSAAPRGVAPRAILAQKNIRKRESPRGARDLAPLPGVMRPGSAAGEIRRRDRARYHALTFHHSERLDHILIEATDDPEKRDLGVVPFTTTRA